MYVGIFDSCKFQLVNDAVSDKSKLVNQQSPETVVFNKHCIQEMASTGSAMDPTARAYSTPTDPSLMGKGLKTPIEYES